LSFLYGDVGLNIAFRCFPGIEMALIPLNKGDTILGKEFDEPLLQLWMKGF